MENELKKVQCKYCKELIDSKASVCPYCRKKQRGSGCSIIILIFVLIIIVGSVGTLMFGTEDLEIINASGKHNKLGISVWEGDLVNKSNATINNIIIKYTCYNESREVVGTVKTKIEHIEGKETLHFQATGLVKDNGGEISCDPSIKRVTDEEFNED